MIYLRSTDERQCQIADALGELTAGELKRMHGRTRTAPGTRSDTPQAQRRKNAS